MISGNNPSANPVLASQIAAQNYGYGATTAPPNLAASLNSGGGGGGIASLAEAHIGFPYVWGGAPARGASDCSGFVNMIVGTLAGLSIPGYPNGSFKGASHGPNTVLWLAWPGAVRIPRSQARAGDLAIWQTHMGIIIDNGVNMVSDLNPRLGTQQTSIDGGGPGFPEVLVCARLIQTQGPTGATIPGL